MAGRMRRASSTGSGRRSAEDAIGAFSSQFSRARSAPRWTARIPVSEFPRLELMINYTHEVSHEWQRRVTLREYRAGRLGKDTVCDADFLLCAAAKHHGTDAPRPCPICGAEHLRVVKWVHSEHLGRRSGTARSDEEIARLVAEVGP